MKDTMNPSSLVSVIIPSYNHAQYVANAIKSVLDQTYRNIELIVADDGSRDNSHEVIRRYGSDPRVRTLLHTENRGQGHVLNDALKIARGDFISFLPSDDWYLPRKIEVQLEKFRTSAPDVGVVYARGQRFFEDTGETIDVKLPVHTGHIAEKLITEGNFIYPVTPLIRREVFDKVPFHLKFKAEGEAIYLRMALHYRFEYVDEVVGVMRDHTYNIGKDVDVMYREIELFWDWFFGLRDLPESVRRLRPVAISRLNRIKGMQFIGEKRNFRRGRECLLRAIATNPSDLLKPKVAAGLALSYLPAPLANQVLDRVHGPAVRSL